MHTMTLKIDDSIYPNFLSFLELLPKDKASIIEDEPYCELNKETQEAINRLESDDKSIERYKTKEELFEALGL